MSQGNRARPLPQRSAGSGTRRRVRLEPATQSVDTCSTLERVSDAYVFALPERLDQLERALDAFRSSPSDPEAREQALVLSHRLRGTAGSYGMFEVGIAAAQIEEEVTRAAVRWSEIEASLAAARSMVARALAAVRARTPR